MTSLVVPVYNGAGVLPATVPHVLALAGVDEWIWVDDGSTDDTARVLARATAAEPRARLVRLPENAGRAAARNAGVAAARGDVFLFLDADVTPRPGYAEALLDALAAPGAVAAVARLDLPDVPDPREPYAVYLRRTRRGVPPLPSRTPVSWRFFVTAACAVHRGPFWRAGGFDAAVPYGEDLALACALAADGAGALVASDARAGTSEVGTLADALAKVDTFGRALVHIARRWPDVYSLAGLERLIEPGLAGRLVGLGAPARAVRAALSALPEAAAARAVRYLLAHALVRAHADALAHAR